MSNQVYNNEKAAVGKPFIDQRVSALEDRLVLPTLPNSLAYFAGTNTGTLASSDILIAGNNLIFPDGSNVTVDSLAAIAPLPGQNYITIAGVNVGTDAPFTFSIIPPVNPTNANVLKTTGSNLQVQFASNTFPGVVSTSTQTFAGDKTFSGIVFVNNIKSATPTTIVIGGDATGMNLTPTSGNITLDPLTVGSGSIFIGNLAASTVQIGKLSSTTTINGTANIANLDRGGTINIGTALQTGITFGRSFSVNNFNGQSLFNDGLTTDTIRGFSAIDVGVDANGLNLGSSKGLIYMDQIDTGDTINIGTSKATDINIGRSGITTVIAGDVNIGGGLLSTFAETSFTSSASGAIPLTANYMTFNLRLINNMVTIAYRILAAAVVATSNNTINITTAISAPYLPVARLSGPAMVNINTQVYPGFITITNAGVISFSVQGGINAGNPLFAIGQTVRALSGSISYSTV